MPGEKSSGFFMAGRILTAEPGRVTKFHADGDRFHIQTVTDVESVLEQAKALHNEGYHTTPGGQRHVGWFPIAVLNAWAIKRGVTFEAVMNDSRLLKEFLNDPDHSDFRIDKRPV